MTETLDMGGERVREIDFNHGFAKNHFLFLQINGWSIGSSPAADKKQAS